MFSARPYTSFHDPYLHHHLSDSCLHGKLFHFAHTVAMAVVKAPEPVYNRRYNHSAKVIKNSRIPVKLAAP